MQCPKCQSSDVNPLSTWYASGTSVIDARTAGVAALYAVRTKGMIKTGRAQLASPPTKWRYLKPTRASLVAGTVGVPILTGVLPRLPGGGVQFPEHLFIPSIIAILACIPILCMAIAVHNWIIVPSQMKAWNSKWMCGSCECVFDVPDCRNGTWSSPANIR
jgi:hypothetical protein